MKRGWGTCCGIEDNKQCNSNSLLCFLVLKEQDTSPKTGNLRDSRVSIYNNSFVDLY